MSDIFREIEQEIRRDDALKLWAKYQIPVYILAALVVLAVAGWRYWDYRRQLAAEALNARYQAALQLDGAGKTQEAQKAFASLAGVGGGYGLLARFAAADSESKIHASAAAAAYDAIAADPKTPGVMRNLARLRAALIHMNDPDPKEAERRLQAIAGPTDPFHASAREQLAILALKRKDYAAAGRWLDMIVSDPLAPAAVRGRAEALEGLVAASGPLPSAAGKTGVGAVAQPAAAAPPPTPAGPAHESAAPVSAPPATPPAGAKRDGGS